MRIIRVSDYEMMSYEAAKIIAATIILKPDCVLGLATGSSPVGTYKKLIEWNKAGDIDFSRVRTVNLDEYVGLDYESDNSYVHFMRDNLFDHINIDLKNTNIPNGKNPDPEAECLRYDKLIRDIGCIDLQLLGLGPNGHIAFNEPADYFLLGTHRVALTETTINANKRFFEREEDVPRFAYTMGIGDIMRAKKVLMVVSGKNKAKALKESLNGQVTPHMPASVLQLHNDCTIVATEDAVSEM